jgi:hypothetical protein
MERHCSSDSIGERLTPAIRTDAGASKSDLRLRSALLPCNTPATINMIAGIVLVEDHSFLYPPSTPLPGLMAFFQFLPFRMQLFQNNTLHHKPQCNPSRFTVLFLYFFFFLILLFGHLGDQCTFALIVLIFLCFCMNFPPLPSPPSHHNSVRIPLFRCSRWSRRYGHRSHVCFLLRCLMLFMRLRRSSIVYFVYRYC